MRNVEYTTLLRTVLAVLITIHARAETSNSVLQRHKLRLSFEFVVSGWVSGHFDEYGERDLRRQGASRWWLVMR